MKEKRNITIIDKKQIPSEEPALELESIANSITTTANLIGEEEEAAVRARREAEERARQEAEERARQEASEKNAKNNT